MRLLLFSHLALFAAIPGLSFVAFLFDRWTVATSPVFLPTLGATRMLVAGRVVTTYFSLDNPAVTQARAEALQSIGVFIFIGCGLILNYLLIRWAEES